MIDLVKIHQKKRRRPRELIGETGVLKNRTEVTMTTTRLTQFPTEWVTGDTLARIIYDTFNKFRITRSVGEMNCVKWDFYMHIQ